MIKLLLIMLVTVFCYLLVLPGYVFSLIGLKGRAWSTYFLSLWGALMCKVIRLEITVHGTPPKPPFFFVSNHLSYVDIMMLISKLRCVFVAKNDVLSWPLFGFMTRTVGMLFVNRNKRSDVKRVNKLISDNITEEQGILLFPESTTSGGFKVLPFKASLLVYPAENNIPVHYSTIRYETPEGEINASDSVCWWGDVTFLSHFTDLLKLKKIYGTITFGDEPILNNDRKLLAEHLYRKVSEGFVPIIEQSEHAKQYSSS